MALRLSSSLPALMVSENSLSPTEGAWKILDAVVMRLSPIVRRPRSLFLANYPRSELTTHIQVRSTIFFLAS